mgnify:CR=1 FL=1
MIYIRQLGFKKKLFFRLKKSKNLQVYSEQKTTFAL